MVYFVGLLCLFGGNVEKEDVMVCVMLEREFVEEFLDVFVSVVMVNVCVYGWYFVVDVKGVYVFIACAFAARIRVINVDVDVLVMDEGELVVLSVS